MTIEKPNIKAIAMRFILLLGVVSFFADATFEGARSITGAYMATLGANAAIVGFVSGFGELVSYGLRLVSGYIVDRTRSYWPLTLFGYGCNLVAVPLLALTGNWKVAALLIIIERFGKAIRTPARDAMLSHASHNIGMGYGFGIHQLLDQLGSMAGPIIITIVLALHGNYSEGFLWLAIPSAAALFTLVTAQRIFPTPSDLENVAVKIEHQEIPRAFWWYLAASMMIAFGFADFPLIAFHWEKTKALSSIMIPIYYVIALAVSAAVAIALGRLYDKKGANVLVWAFLLSTFFAPLVFYGHNIAMLFGMILWGIGMGAQSSVLKAIIGSTVPKAKRGTAFGIFNTCYGVAWFLGSALMGLLYDINIHYLVAVSIIAQLMFFPLLVVAQKKQLEVNNNDAAKK